MRSPIVAANWKMHKTAGEAVGYFRRLLELVAPQPKVELVIFPPATLLSLAKKHLEGSPIGWGAQNAYPEPQGAFTGEVSVVQVADLGARYLICGHSERRHIFGEDDELIGRKVWAALETGLVPILCVGELLEERQAGRAWEVVERQLSAALEGVELPSPERLVIAYEPVWAIGTGVPARPEDAQGMAARIRKWLEGRFGKPGRAIRIQYGGSVKPDNAREFLGLPDIDGALVGGASLDPDKFWAIAQAAA
ncbi:triose-phosphate isomerase [Candidatus Bipolaricaulota bacterium]|nr:triose-phosphate isomerase [Candidatus Bipolaricaulota bacterium]